MYYILFLLSLLRLLVTANVPSSLILVTLMMEAIRSSESSVLTRATLRDIQQEGILHSHRRENLKFYKDSERIFKNEILGTFTNK
jgi:hypothetical protein